MIRKWLKSGHDCGNQKTVIIRSGKGDKNRRTILLEMLKDDLIQRASEVRALYDQDRREDLNGVCLPGALERNHPNGGKEWGWFWLFPPLASGVRSINRTRSPVRRPGSSRTREKGTIRVIMKN